MRVLGAGVAGGGRYLRALATVYRNPSFVSPTDNMMTPCSQKISAAKKKHFAKCVDCVLVIVTFCLTLLIFVGVRSRCLSSLRTRRPASRRPSLPSSTTMRILSDHRPLRPSSRLSVSLRLDLGTFARFPQHLPPLLWLKRCCNLHFAFLYSHRDTPLYSLYP